MNTTLLFTSIYICFFLMLTISRAEQKIETDKKAIVPPTNFASLYGRDDFFDINSDEHELEKRRFNAWAGKRSRLTKRRFNAWAGR